MKKLSEQQVIGQQGVHLLGGRLLSVGLSFQSSGPLDAGIDGFLELRDPSTGEVRAQWITAQLKTQKTGRFAEETDEGFSYICRRQDLDYWLGSNVPVVLFVAKADRRADLLEGHPYPVLGRRPPADPQGRLRQEQG